MSICRQNINFRNALARDSEVDYEGIYRDFMSCGEYFFDGHYNVVRFPAGMVFYHGSPALANSLYTFPLGMPIFNVDIPVPDIAAVASNPEEIEAIIAEAGRDLLIPGWFSSYHVAKIYISRGEEPESKVCAAKGSCILSYTLKNDAVFLLLTDPLNITKLKSEYPAQARNISVMFGDIPYRLRNDAPIDSNPITIVKTDPKLRRTSFYEQDRAVCSSLCKTLFRERNYAGYVGGKMRSSGDIVFHVEITFCNSAKHLERNFNDPHDWQYNRIPDNKPLLKKFISIMKLFKTTDIKLHSGNLYEHSVWSLLWCENLIKLLPKTKLVGEFISSQEIMSATKLASLLHDIGKQVVQGEHIKRKQGKETYIYHSIPNHEKIAVDYLNNNRSGPYTETYGESPSLSGLLEELNINYPAAGYINLLSLPILCHVTINKIYLALGVDDSLDVYKRAAVTLIDKVNSTAKRVVSDVEILSIILVGSSSMLGSIPYGIQRIRGLNIGDNINKVSEFIPYISNVSAIYKGPRDDPRYDAESIRIKTTKLIQAVSVVKGKLL